MYCSKCGAPMADGAALCSACGQASSSTVALPRTPMMNGLAAAAAPRVAYGGFWLRFVAYLIDGVVMSLGVILVLIPLIFLTGLGALLSEIHPQEELSDAGVFLIIGVIMAGRRVSFGRATGRHFAKIVTNMVPAFIGYIMAGFTAQKQALHDMIAGCLILRRSNGF